MYISSGEVGAGGDPQNRAQNKSTFLGKLLRINNSGTTYSIPPTNPFTTTGGLPEIFAVGLTNPWKLFFDKNNGDLWIADVGQSGY